MRRRWMTTLARLYHLTPRDLDRLRLWEFWEFIRAAESALSREGAPGG